MSNKIVNSINNNGSSCLEGGTYPLKHVSIKKVSPVDKVSKLYREKVKEQSEIGKRIRDIEFQLMYEKITHKDFLKLSIDQKELVKEYEKLGLICAGISLAREELF